MKLIHGFLTPESIDEYKVCTAKLIVHKAVFGSDGPKTCYPARIGDFSGILQEDYLDVVVTSLVSTDEVTVA